MMRTPPLSTREELEQLTAGGHPEQRQVKTDIMRSFTHYQEDVSRFTATPLAALQEQLELIINAVLCAQPDLHYYQGFHDIASVLLLVTDQVGLAHGLLQQLSVHHLRPYHSATITPVLAILAGLYPLLSQSDPALVTALQQLNIPPYFALSWIITWFSHDLPCLDLTLRIFDFLIASHPFMPLYLSAAFVLARRQLLVTAIQQSPDFAIIHHQLREIPRSADWNAATIEELLVCARYLFVLHPPASILSPEAVAFYPPVDLDARAALLSPADRSFFPQLRDTLKCHPDDVWRTLLPSDGDLNPRPMRPSWLLVGAAATLLLVGVVILLRSSAARHHQL
jgi:hypothetical protein